MTIPMLLVGGRLISFLAISRIAYVLFDEEDPDDVGENALAAVTVGLLWPAMLAGLLVAAPFHGAYWWIVKRPTPRQRREHLKREYEKTQAMAAKLELPAPEVK